MPLLTRFPRSAVHRTHAQSGPPLTWPAAKKALIALSTV
jgi:hypothetical protein